MNSTSGGIRSHIEDFWRYTSEVRLLIAVIWCLPLPAQPVFFRNVRVFDGERVLPRASVLVENGVIRAVALDLKQPTKAELIEGAGKTLLPGLIDAHAHIAAPEQLRQALAFGVSTELDMFSLPEVMADYPALVRKGQATDLADARFAGICVTAPGGHGTQYGRPIPTIREPWQAQQFVDARLAEGSDYVKIIYKADIGGYPSISRDTLAAVVAAAHRRGKLAVVHINTLEGAREAIEAGVDGLAHLFRGAASDPALVQLAKEHHTFIVPTWSQLKNSCGTNTGAAIATEPRFQDDLPPTAVKTLLTARQRASFPSCEGARQITPQLRDAGVPLLAGTDVGNPGLAHGASLHGELAILVEMGLTPVEALRAATSAPAAAFGLQDRGRIAPGLRADLMLVEGDPTKDISATRNITMVWKQGRQFDRAAYRRDVPQIGQPKASAGLQLGPVSDFDGGNIKTAFGSAWQAFDGVTMSPVSRGANGTRGALAIQGEVEPGRLAHLWPGIVFFPGGQLNAAVDPDNRKELRFYARGDGQTYRVVLETTAGRQEQRFVAGSAWAEQRIVFREGTDSEPYGLLSIIFAGPSTPGHFEFQIDEVRFQ